MAAKTLKFRVRHRYRRSRRQVEGLSQQAEEHIEQHFVSRLTRLFLVKRFVLAWVLLIVLLAGDGGGGAAAGGQFAAGFPRCGGL